MKTTKLILSFSLILFFAHYKTLALSPSNTNNDQSKSFFIENKGQWNQQILFLARTSGLNYWITTEGIVYDFYELAVPEKSSTEFNSDLQSENIAINGHIVKSSFQKSNQASMPSFIGIEKQSAYYNYFIGNNSSNWAADVPLYSEVLAKNIYKGIDARFYFDHNSIRYDLMLMPNADISQIKFNFEGQNDLFVNNDGELEFKTSIGNVIHHNIFAYQLIDNVKKEIKCKFTLIGNATAGFDVEVYNPKYPLIIDPIIYSTFIGSSNIDHGYDIEVDATGNSYVTGTTLSANFPKTTGAYKTTLTASSDAFVTKLNTTGTALIFSTFIGGNNAAGGVYYENFASILLDATNNMLLTGTTNSTNFPTTAGVYQPSYGGGVSDGIIVKLNSTGTALLYSTLLGGTSEERITCEFWDASGNIYVVGAVGTGSSNYPVTPGAFQTTYAGGSYDGFLTKLNPTASSLIFSTFYGGNLYDLGRSLAVDALGNSYITGVAYSTNFPTTAGAFRSFCGGTQDAFVLKMNATGTATIYSTYLGGSGDDYGHGIAVDKSGNAYVVGFTGSSNFPVITGNYKTTYQGGSFDGFMCKLNAAGSALLFSSYLGGNSDDTPYKIRLNADSSFLITGWTTSTNFPTTNCPVQSTYGGGASDGFITLVNPTCTSLMYSTFLGGSGEDRSSGIQSFADHYVYTTGYSGSSNFPLTAGSFQTTFGGSTYDATVTKIFIDTLNLQIGAVNPLALCPGTNISVPFTVGCILFNAGNVFTAQLSDSIGNFGSPINIGTLIGTSSGTISAKIPANTPYGTGYRIRVTSSNPSFIGTSLSAKITVYALPKANFTINDTTQCLNSNKFIFSNTSSIVSGSMFYLWNFGDNTTSTLNSPVYNYSSTGTYSIKLIAYSDHNCNDSVIKTVYVYPVPSVAFGINDSDQCLQGNNFVFSNTSAISTGTLSYLWHFGDNSTSNQTNSSHSYGKHDTFDVKLVAISDHACSDSISKKVYILANPKPDFSINDSLQCLSANSFNFNNKSSIPTGSMLYKWHFGNNDSSSIQSPIYSYSVPGKYFVKMVAMSDQGCIDSIVKSVQVIKNPLADFMIDDTLQCFGSNLFQLTNLSDTNYTSFTWNFGDSHFSSALNPAYSYSSSGKFKIRLLANILNKCFDSIIKDVTVLPGPKADFSINDTVQCFDKNSFVFTNLSDTSLGNIQFKWIFSDGIIESTANSQRSFSLVGNYTVKLIASSGISCSDSITKSIHILRKTEAKFSFDSNKCNSDISFYSQSQGAKTVLWDFGDGVVSKDSCIVHGFKDTGKYLVTLYTNRGLGCADSFSSFVEVLQSGINIFPPNIFTPNNDGLNEVFRIYGLKYDCHPYDLYIYNRWGQMMYDSRTQNNNSEPFWNGYYKGIKVSSGVYIFIISGEKFTKCGSVTVIY